MKYLNLQWVGGDYYEHPDGEDLIGKLCFTTKIGAYIGAVSGAVAACLPPEPKLKGAIVKNLQFFIPAVGASALFTVITYMSTNLRKKDDIWNHAIGGFIGGSFLGVCSTSRFPAVFFGTTGSFFATVLKYYALNDKCLYSPKTRSSAFYTKHFNAGIIKERKGDWTRNPI